MWELPLASLSRDIVVQPLLTETLALVVSRAHPLAHESHLQLQALTHSR